MELPVDLRMIICYFYTGIIINGVLYAKRKNIRESGQDHKNAKISASDKDKPMASALAVKDGKFIMPGIIDSHVLTAEPEGSSYNKPRDMFF